MWYQLDTWQGPWLAAPGVAPYFTLTTPSLLWGNHILYAFATDGQDANSTGVAQQSIGSMAAYLFTVVPAGTTTALTSAPNPALWGQSVTFTATVTVTPPGTGTPTGTVTFSYGTITLGSAPVDSSGHAVYATSTLGYGYFDIIASYSGDTNFVGSTSPVLVQYVNAPAVGLSPKVLTFGNQAMNTTSVKKTVTLTNSGTATLDFSSISITGDFEIVANTCPATVVVGKKCQVSVTFTPTGLGSRTGTLMFSDNSPNNPQTVPLSGTGVVPATLTPASATYAAQKVGTTSAAKTFTLTNMQPVALTGIAILTYAPYAVSATTCTTSLAAKAKCTISVTFTPQAAESYQAALFVYDSASNSPQTSSLLGTGK